MKPQSNDDPEIAAQAFDLMRTLVALTGEKWVNPSRFQSLADTWSQGDAAARVAFLTGVRNLVREIPVKVFSDLEARQSLLNAAQEALDVAIEMEEEGQEENES